MISLSFAEQQVKGTMTMDMEAEAREEQQQQEEDDAGVSCSLDMFREHQEVHQMVHAISQVVETEFTAEKAFEDLGKILNNYQVVFLLAHEFGHLSYG